MFFRRKKRPTVTFEDKHRGKGWDEETVKHITKRDCFDVQITNVEKRGGFGEISENRPMRSPNGHSVSGVMTFPKLILVSISFVERGLPEVGGWFYDRRGDLPLPVLELYLSDRDGSVASAIFEAHQAALLSGQRYSLARFWKRKGDGVMTEKDREHGSTYGSHYPLIGLHTWAVLESVNLPEWAVPYASGRFSIKNLPEFYQFRL